MNKQTFHNGILPRFNEKAQSLVETAILAPLAIFLLIGVFEIGFMLKWAFWLIVFSIVVSSLSMAGVLVWL